MRRPAVLVFVLALLLRLAAVGVTGPSRTEFGDAADYMLHAGLLCTEGAYPERGNNYFFRAPGLPVLIAATTGCRPARVAAIKIGLAAIDALTAALIVLLAWQLWRQRPAAVAAGLLAAVHPVFLLQVCDVRSEPLFMLFLTAALALSLAAARGRPSLALAAGIACGLAALTRPAGLLVAPLLAVAALGAPAAKRGTRLRTAGALVLGAVLSIAPWTARNALRWGELLPVNDAFGINLWRGASPSLRAVLRAEGGAELEAAQRAFERDVRDTAGQVDARAATPGARSREWRRLAVAAIRDDPGDYAAFSLRRLAGYWRPWLDPRFHRPAAVAASAAVLVPLLALALAGLWRLRTADRWSFLIVSAFLLLGWLSHVPFQTVMRFRVPFTDPLLLALAAWPLATVAARLAARLQRSAPPR